MCGYLWYSVTRFSYTYPTPLCAKCICLLFFPWTWTSQQPNVSIYIHINIYILLPFPGIVSLEDARQGKLKDYFRICILIHLRQSLDSEDTKQTASQGGPRVFHDFPVLRVGMWVPQVFFLPCLSDMVPLQSYDYQELLRSHEVRWCILSPLRKNSWRVEHSSSIFLTKKCVCLFKLTLDIQIPPEKVQKFWFPPIPSYLKLPSSEGIQLDV